MKIRLNQNLSTPFGKLKKDEVIEIPADNEGIALQSFWRGRIRDSAIDNCVTIIAEEKSLDSNETNEGEASSGEANSISIKNKNKK